jgi:uncharacterized protein (TIGR03437 family)
MGDNWFDHPDILCAALQRLGYHARSWGQIKGSPIHNCVYPPVVRATDSLPRCNAGVLGPTGDSLGYATVAARAGDNIELFAGGLGPTNPAAPPAGQAFFDAAPTAGPVTLLINNLGVTPAFAGLVGAGLYQINLTVPAGLGTGDVPLVAAVGGSQTPPYVVISFN